jgi:hypothetical protein
MRSALVGLAIAFITPFFATQSVIGQSKATVTSAQVRLDKSKPNVYIAFERRGPWKPLKKFESRSRVWLRLINNSRWNIAACMWDVSKEYGEKELVYEVETFDPKHRVQAPITTNPEGSCPRMSVIPGTSILFSVPHEHLSDGLAIKIQFRYEWETDPDGYASALEPKHFAYFYSSDIQKTNSTVLY